MGLFSFLKGDKGDRGLRGLKGKDGVNGMGFKTILDYGATMYTNYTDCVNGKDSSKAIQDMADDVGRAILPPYGWFKNEKTTVFKKQGQGIVSLGSGNRGVHLISTKSIDMFKPIYFNQEVSGFTAWYVGKHITKECAVVRFGGVPVIRPRKEKYLKDFTVKESNSWERTQSIGTTLDFDFEGRPYFKNILNKLST